MTGPTEITLGNAVDWRFAASIGAWLARPAPPSTEYTRSQVIDELMGAAEKAEPPVRDVTGLVTGGRVPPARVVDRPAWIRAAAESMRTMTNGGDKPRGFLTGRITGAQAGAVLAYVASGILGQYDPFGEAENGCLLLVYPNVIAVERQLKVKPSDFRLWVCLHEVTHRVQFRANPWLAEYMSRALGLLVQEPGDDLGQVMSRLADFARSRGNRAAAADDSSIHPAGILGLVRAVQSEPQRIALDQLLVLGTLLEGHAEHVMDAVGPVVVPSVATIRSRFDDRRNRRQPPFQRLMRALLGFDAKLSQYTRGKAFVDDVVDRVGMRRFNAIWSGPETLPLPAEIEDPRRWIDRVL
ncbi:zinc-dependent metalloprotease [Mycobacterium sp.]|uniref:zinc-dependent metalloprotease n=1 Tax=Mycobacterium sp. TaxID=1785 RepID=UPI003BAAB7FF